MNHSKMYVTFPYCNTKDNNSNKSSLKSNVLRLDKIRNRNIKKPLLYNRSSSMHSSDNLIYNVHNNNRNSPAEFTSDIIINKERNMENNYNTSINYVNNNITNNIIVANNNCYHTANNFIQINYSPSSSNIVNINKDSYKYDISLENCIDLGSTNTCMYNLNNIHNKDINNMPLEDCSSHIGSCPNEQNEHEDEINEDNKKDVTKQQKKKKIK